jgi:transposase
LDTNPTFGVFFMAKYDEQFKLKAVRQYVSGLSRSRSVASYPLHGRASLAKKFSHYGANVKREVLERIEREDLSDQFKLKGLSPVQYRTQAFGP